MKQGPEVPTGESPRQHKIPPPHPRPQEKGSIFSIKTAVMATAVAAIAVVGGARLIERSNSSPEVTGENYTRHLSADPNVFFSKVDYPLVSGEDYLRELNGIVPRGQNLMMSNSKTGETVEITTPAQLLEHVDVKSDEQAQAVALAIDVNLTTSFGGERANVETVGDKTVVDLWQRPFFGSGERPVRTAKVVIDEGEGTIHEDVGTEVVGSVDIGIVD